MSLAWLIRTQNFLEGGYPSSVVNTLLGDTDLQRRPERLLLQLPFQRYLGSDFLFSFQHMCLSFSLC